MVDLINIGQPRRALALALAIVAFSCATAAPAAALSNGVAATPPMGWNQWDHFGCRVSERLVIGVADAFVRTGMKRAGYRYVNVDDCWMARSRDQHGNLRADPAEFPRGIAPVAREVHSMGLRFGMYISAGTLTCERFPGSRGNYLRDLRTLASWGVDYVKVDWCFMPRGSHPQPIYAAIRADVAKTHRRMVISECIQGFAKPWLWGARAGNLWRMSRDVHDSWRAVMKVVDRDAPLARYAGPGAWNDPDMLQTGDHNLTDTEGRAQFSLWSMLAAPLIAGNDVRYMTAATRATLTNGEVIAVDQDRAGRQGMRVRAAHGHEVWIRPLSGGDWAVLLLNRTSSPTVISADLRSLAPLTRASRYAIRDLWSRRDAGTAGPIRLHAAAHGVAMLRVRPIRTRRHR